tara:strand:+ start:166 stop:417 length:252 start_codon:yes stop_codon:yes gene_type:complete
MLRINIPENCGIISIDKYNKRILKDSRIISAMIDDNWIPLPTGIKRYRGYRIGLLAFIISCEIGFRVSELVNWISKYSSRMTM